ncbi:MAG: hypothetical protein CMM63_02275 [Rhodospirillaceae bacterium]|nr:hypothetical protein [Rhodospirillaceae bacterium]
MTRQWIAIGDRFENDLTRLDADFAKLLLNQKAVFFVISISGEANVLASDTRRAVFCNRLLSKTSFRNCFG